MDIKLIAFEPGRKIVAIKGLRMAAKNFAALEGNEFTNSYPLREAKAVFDRMDQGEQPVVKFAMGGEVNRKVALAIFEAHGVTAEYVEPRIEVPVSLLERLRDAVSPRVSQSNWDLSDAVDDLLREAGR